MNWRSFLAVLGVAVVGGTGYFLAGEDGRVFSQQRAREGRGRFGREGPSSGSAVAEPCPRTNSALMSERFDEAVWLINNDLVAAPAITADAALSPFGAMTADRIVFPATTALQDSILFQKSCPNGPAASSASIYVRGRAAGAASGTIDFCKLTSIAISNCTACDWVKGSYTRCTVPNHVVTLDQGYLYIGNASLFNGGTARLGADLDVWGAQCEDGATVSAYIGPVLGTAVTRSCP